METNRLEYKRELTEDLEKEVVAFLNYHDGGVIQIGVSNDGAVFGVPNADKTMLVIKDRLRNNIAPSCMGLFDVYPEIVAEKQIIIINVASGSEKPYYIRRYGMSDRGCYIRIGSASEPMTIRMIEDAFARRQRVTLGTLRSPRRDLTFEQLRIYYDEAGLTLGDKFAANLELFLESGEYNYAAYLLADRNGNSVQVAKYAGTDRIDLLKSEECGYCSIIKTCKRVLDALDAENITAMRITGKSRITRRLWNHVALREAVINAIVHNDYSEDLVPKFEIFSDRLEITSAAAIHKEEQDTFFDGFSSPRNKILMRVFKDLDMVEHLGSGMPRILAAYPREAYIFSVKFVRMVLLNDAEAVAMLKSGNAGSMGSEKTSEKTSEKILTALAKDGRLTIAQLAEITDVTGRSVERNIKRLQEDGRLMRVGPDKGGYWQVNGE